MLLRFLCFIFILLAFPARAGDEVAGNVEAVGRTPSNLAVERVMLKSVPVAVEQSGGTLAAMATELPKAMAAFKEKLAAKGIAVTGATLVQFHTSQSGDEFTTYTADIMLPVVVPKEKQPDLNFGVSPAGQALRVVHKGAYAAIEDSYFELSTFVEDQGFEIGDFTLERYLSDAETAEKDRLTEIYVPLK